MNRSGACKGSSINTNSSNLESRREERRRPPWLWVPSLYFSEGVPYVVVMTMSVVMYQRLGFANADIAFYTSWLSLPWVLKPLWSPWVDLTRTKRFWIVAMQGVVAAGLALAALSLLTGFSGSRSFCFDDDGLCFRHP